MSDRAFQFMPGDVSALAGDGSFYWWCPGCRELHCADTLTPNSNGATWGRDGDLARPTLSPSVLLRIDYGQAGKPPEICHCWIRGGRIEFCSDSTHELAGKTVAMEVPEELR